MRTDELDTAAAEQAITAAAIRLALEAIAYKIRDDESVTASRIDYRALTAERSHPSPWSLSEAICEAIVPEGDWRPTRELAYDFGTAARAAGYLARPGKYDRLMNDRYYYAMPAHRPRHPGFAVLAVMRAICAEAAEELHRNAREIERASERGDDDELEAA